MTTAHFTVIRDESGDGVVRLALAGKCDLAAVDELDRAVDSALTTAVEIYVDLDALTFIDSSAIASLVAAVYKARRLGLRLSVLNPHDTVRVVLDRTGVLGHLTNPEWPPAHRPGQTPHNRPRKPQG
jgi:anti-sigma B factor antagonist